jgi:predicted membrane protein
MGTLTSSISISASSTPSHHYFFFIFAIFLLFKRVFLIVFRYNTTCTCIYCPIFYTIVLIFYCYAIKNRRVRHAVSITSSASIPRVAANLSSDVSPLVHDQAEPSSTHFSHFLYIFVIIIFS